MKKEKIVNASPIANIILAVIVLAILGILTYYSLNLLKIRSRDAQRVSDLAMLKSSVEQKFKMEKALPASGYDKLNLGIFMREMPKDPLNNKDYKYKYISNGISFVFYDKMEKGNFEAQNDSGKYKNYYEAGYGKDWQKLVPDNLK